MKSLLKVGLVIFIIVLIWRLDEGDRVSSIEPCGKITFEKDTVPKGIIDLNGQWKMYFDFSICNSVYYKNKNIQNKYSIYITHKGWEVSGKGSKISEIRDGKEMPYNRASPISLNGTIQSDTLVLNFFENNIQEVAGVITIFYVTKNFKLSGFYKASGNNCDCLFL